MIRRILLGAAFLAFVLLVPACGSDDAKDSKSPAKNVPPDPGVPAPTPKGGKAG